MKNYNREKIDELLQPLMKMMQEEFPNGFKLIVEPYFSQIVYEHDEMVFQSDEIKNKRAFAPFIEDTAQTTPTADTSDTE